MGLPKGRKHHHGRSVMEAAGCLLEESVPLGEIGNSWLLVLLWPLDRSRPMVAFSQLLARSRLMAAFGQLLVSALRSSRLEADDSSNLMEGKMPVS